MTAKTPVLISLLVLALMVASACTSVPDKSPISPNESNAPTVNEIKRAADAYTGQAITLSGKVTQACPDDGCFFYLNDGTGSIKVDLKPIKSRVSPKNNGAPIRVYGQLVNNGSVPHVNATKILLN